MFIDFPFGVSITFLFIICPLFNINNWASRSESPFMREYNLYFPVVDMSIKTLSMAVLEFRPNLVGNPTIPVRL